MADHAKKNLWNAYEQYGSKKKCNAQELSLNMKLIDDILRMTHSKGAFISKDAKNCYNQITHPIMSMALQCLGIPLPVVQSMVHVFHHMHHHL